MTFACKSETALYEQSKQQNKLWLWISEDTSQKVNDICEQAHKTASVRNKFFTLKT